MLHVENNLLLQSCGSSHESFPFANDNMGTIRMRQQQHNSGSASQLSQPLQFQSHAPIDGKLMPDPSQAKRSAKKRHQLTFFYSNKKEGFQWKIVHMKNSIEF